MRTDGTCLALSMSAVVRGAWSALTWQATRWCPSAHRLLARRSCRHIQSADASTLSPTTSASLNRCSAALQSTIRLGRLTTLNPCQRGGEHFCALANKACSATSTHQRAFPATPTVHQVQQVSCMQVLRPPPPVSSRDDCFALRFSIMSESAAFAVEQPEQLVLGRRSGLQGAGSSVTSPRLGRSRLLARARARDTAHVADEPTLSELIGVGGRT